MSLQPLQITGLVLTVFRLNGRLLAWGDRFTADYGLTSARWQMLGALALANAPLATPRIAESMGVTRQAARKQLALLARDGLVRRQANPHHRRSPLFALTDLGRARYDAIEAGWNRHAEGLAKHLDAKDVATTRRVLETLLEAHLSGGVEERR